MPHGYSRDSASGLVAESLLLQREVFGTVGDPCESYLPGLRPLQGRRDQRPAIAGGGGHPPPGAAF